MFRLLLVISLPFYLAAQTGPAGIGSVDGNSDLSLWLKLDSIDAEMAPLEDNFEYWKDRSGKRNHLHSYQNRSFPSLVIKNSYPAVFFDGDDYMQMNNYSPGFNNTAQTIFVVGSKTDAGTIVSIAANKWDNELLLFNDAIYHHNSSGNFTYKYHQCLKGKDLHPLSTMTATFNQSPNEISLLLNNTPTDLPLITNGQVGDYKMEDRKLTLGQRAKFVNSEYLNGYIYEVIVYNRILLQYEIDQIHRYLSCKYDLNLGYCSTFSHFDCTNLGDPEIDKCDTSLTLYPTVTSDHLYLMPFSEGTQVSIYNSAGQCVVQNKTIDKNSFPVFTLPVGIYFILVDNECGQNVYKFIKN